MGLNLRQATRQDDPGRSLPKELKACKGTYKKSSSIWMERRHGILARLVHTGLEKVRRPHDWMMDIVNVDGGLCVLLCNNSSFVLRVLALQ